MGWDGRFMRRLSACGTPRIQSLYRSIKGQIFLVFAATFLSVFALTVLHFAGLSTVKTRLLLGERYDDLLNNILEVRRFEKNYLFYNDADSLQEGIDYLKRIDVLVSELSDDIVRVAGRDTFKTFQNALSLYERSIASLGTHPADTSEMREIVRKRGKTLVDFAENLIQTKRTRIHSTIVKTSLLPFAFLFIFLLLMLLTIRLISMGLLRPLSVLQSTIRRVARGDYSPIPYEGMYTEEIYGLIGAVNRMAQELEMNQEDLLQARKIAALGTFTAGIAHELNNPINNISLTVELFLEEYAEKLDAEGTEMVQDILAQTERAGDIVRSLLDFSRTERPVFSNLDTAEIVRSTVALARNQIMLAGMRLKVDIPQGLPAVMGDFRGLQQVFMNLLVNAIQATPEGGEITVTGELDSVDFVRVDIRDTGAGIPEELLQHIFEPFFTTKEVGKGTGLGLSVVYSLIKRHGGRIEVKSEVGRGTVFSVHLPVVSSRIPIGGKIPEVL